MISITKKKHRLIRWAVIALLIIIFFASHELKPADYIPTAMMEQGPNLPTRGGLDQLNQLPGDSVDRVAFITFSYVKHNDTKKLFEFLLPAVDTWAAPENNHSSVYPSLYVVFSHPSRGPFENFCIDGNNMTVEQLKLCNHIQPIYVDCPEGKVGESPCCKQQKGLLEIIQNNNNKYPLYDWYAFFDDDVYLRKEYLAKLLHVLQPPDFPMAAAPYNQLPKHIGFQKDKVCGQGLEEFTYPWGMPIFYSRGAVRMMANGYAANSLVEQCLAFEVTHDVGNAIVNWMYSLPVARLPPLQPLMDFRDDYIGSHWVGRDDMRKFLHGEDRVDRKGRLSKALPEGAYSFDNTHKKWMSIRPPDIRKLLTVRNPDSAWYRNVTGFTMTDTYVVHGDPRLWKEGDWHVMRVEDCDIAREEEQQK